MSARTNDHGTAGARTGSSSLDGTLPRRAGGSRGAIDFRRLRELVSMEQVLFLLGWQSVTHRGPQCRGPCPVHRSESESNRSLSVHLGRHVFQCFKCGARGNQLDLYSQVSGLPLYEACLDLCERLSLDAPLRPTRNE